MPAEASPTFRGRVVESSSNPRPNETSSAQTRLNQTRPAQTRPDLTRPDQTRPDQIRPDQTRPDKTRPDQTRPDQTRPDQTRPDQPEQPPLSSRGKFAAFSPKPLRSLAEVAHFLKSRRKCLPAETSRKSRRILVES